MTTAMLIFPDRRQDVDVREILQRLPQASCFFVPTGSLFDQPPPLATALPLVDVAAQISASHPDFIVSFSPALPVAKLLWPRTPVFLAYAPASSTPDDERVHRIDTDFGAILPAVEAYQRRERARFHPYTRSGDPEQEREIDRIVRAIQFQAHRVFAGTRTTVILAGGYGRGEGGLLQRGEKFLPSNNLDVLLLPTMGDSFFQRRRFARFAAALGDIERREGITIDLGRLRRTAVERGPLKLFYYDFAQGHKQLHGDTKFLANPALHDARRLAPEELLVLATNRASLLLLNQWLLTTPIAERKIPLLVRHVMKSVIASGDYLLFMSGQFSWSYQRKLEFARSLELPLLQPLRPDYEQAVEFRFFPDYAGYDLPRVRKINERALDHARAVFRHYCAHRKIGSADYKRFILGSRRGGRPRPVRTLRGYLRLQRTFAGKLQVPARDLWRLARLSHEEIILACFPFFAFAQEDWGYGDWRLLGERQQIYADIWEAFGDPNFAKLKDEVTKAR